MIKSLLVFLTGVLFGLHNGLGSAIRIGVTSHYHEDVVPNAFNLRCDFDKKGNCEETIILLQLFKNKNKIIASIQGNEVITHSRLLKSSVVTDGHIDNESGQSFLSVTINEAVKEDSGLYTCSVVFLDDSGHTKKEIASENVTIQNQDIQDVVRHLLVKISFMETLAAYQQNKTQEQLSFLQTQVVDQGMKLQKCKDDINQLSQKQHNDIISSFYAGFQSKGSIFKSTILKFPMVKQNIGNNFDRETGLYTAPVEGLYAFHFFAMSYGGSGRREVQVQVLTNNEVAATLMVEQRDNYDQSSVSCVVKLNAGDTVKCMVNYVGGGQVRLHSFPYTGFTGYLISTSN